MGAKKKNMENILHMTKNYMTRLRLNIADISIKYASHLL